VTERVVDVIEVVRVDVQHAQRAGLFAHSPHQGLEVQLTETARGEAGHGI
jgi:hypothetical protein